MNVGLAWASYQENIGGGYTFVTEVLKAVQRSVLPEGWKTVLIRLDDGALPQGLQFPEQISRDRCDSSSFIKKLFRSKTHPLRSRTDRPVPSFQGRPLDAFVDILFFPFPGYLLGARVPQVSIVWDLSHRSVPFFPEISHEGQREAREHHFSQLMRCADKIIVGTERGALEAQIYYGIDPSHVWKIPHPTPRIGALEIGADDEPRHNFALYPAQFWAHKNHITLVDAWSKLSKVSANPPKLVLVGKDYGNESWVREKVAQSSLEHLVEFRGFVPKAELLNLYKKASILVYPSIFGPENLPPLEAMALGCPVAIADYPGAREQCGEAAVYIDPLNAVAWAEGVGAVTTDPHLSSRLRLAGYKRAKSFTADDFAKELISKLVEFSELRRLWRTISV